MNVNKLKFVELECIKDENNVILFNFLFSTEFGGLIKVPYAVLRADVNGIKFKPWSGGEETLRLGKIEI